MITLKQILLRHKGDLKFIALIATIIGVIIGASMLLNYVASTHTGYILDFLDPNWKP